MRTFKKDQFRGKVRFLLYLSVKDKDFKKRANARTKVNSIPFWRKIRTFNKPILVKKSGYFGPKRELSPEGSQFEGETRPYTLNIRLKNYEF